LAQAFIDLIRQTEFELRTEKHRDRVKLWLNRANREVCRAFSWPFTEIPASSPSKADMPNYYTLPTDFRLPKSVRVETASGAWSKLTVVTTGYEDEIHPKQTDQGTPERAIFTGGLLLIRPGFKDTTSTIHLRYFREAPTMTADVDIPLVPSGDRDVIVMGAVALGSRWLFQDKGDQDRRRDEFLDSLKIMVSNHFRDNAKSQAISLDTVFANMVMDAGSV
jgi:hypothetical protein